MKKNKKTLLSLSLLSTTALFAALLASNALAVDSVKETIRATIDSSCGLYDSYTSATVNTPSIAKTYEKSMVNGELWNKENTGNVANGATYAVVCNDTGGWIVTAAGSQATDRENKMTTSVTANDISTGTLTSGATANWAFKVTGSNNITIPSGINAYHAVPDPSGETVASSTSATDSTASFTTGYQVYIGTETPAGTYEGSVTYTLTHPATSSNNDNPGGSTEDPGNNDNPGGNTENPGNNDNPGGNNDNPGGNTEPQEPEPDEFEPETFHVNFITDSDWGTITFFQDDCTTTEDSPASCTVYVQSVPEWDSNHTFNGFVRSGDSNHYYSWDPITITGSVDLYADWLISAPMWSPNPAPVYNNTTHNTTTTTNNYYNQNYTTRTENTTNTTNTTTNESEPKKSDAEEVESAKGTAYGELVASGSNTIEEGGDNTLLIAILAVTAAVGLGAGAYALHEKKKEEDK